MIYKITKFIFVINLIMLISLCPSIVFAYVYHAPIVIKDINATPDNPYIIEDYEITNQNGTCIEMLNSENIIIKNNYLHDCKLTPMPTGRVVLEEGGYAIYAQDIKNLKIENNTINDNFRGVQIDTSKNIILANNNQTNTYRDACFLFRNCFNIIAHDNFAKNNGATEVLRPISEGIIEADGRLQGIILWETSPARIYNNKIINSSSDGIGIAGSTLENPEGRVSDIWVYNNTLLYNGEQGVWMVSVNDSRICDNYIAFNKARPGFGGGSSGISFEFDVYNTEIYNNIIESNDNCGIAIKNSHDNIIINNSIKNHFNPGICFQGDKSPLPVYWTIGSYNNYIIENNITNNTLGGIVFSVGDWNFNGTVIKNNYFDMLEEESIKSRNDTSGNEGNIPNGVLTENNFFKEEKPVIFKDVYLTVILIISALILAIIFLLRYAKRVLIIARTVRKGRSK